MYEGVLLGLVPGTHGLSVCYFYYYYFYYYSYYYYHPLFGRRPLTTEVHPSQRLSLRCSSQHRPLPM